MFIYDSFFKEETCLRICISTNMKPFSKMFMCKHNLDLLFLKSYEYLYKLTACLTKASLRIPVIKKARRAPPLAASALWQRNNFTNICTNTFATKQIHTVEQNIYVYINIYVYLYICIYIISKYIC